MALKYNPITGEFEEEKPIALKDLVFDPISGEFKAPESKTLVKTETNDLLLQLKQTIRDLLEKVQVKPGVTTVQDMERLGYKAKDSGSSVFLSKSGSFIYLFSDDRHFINHIDIRGAALPSIPLWSHDRKYADWCSLFRQLGFFVREIIRPHQFEEYYSAAFDVEDRINGLRLKINFFYRLKSSFSKELAVPIDNVSVQYDIEKSTQFNIWLYGIDNRVNTHTSHSEKSYGITGDKTVKQIIESPLGDASVDFATATYDSLREWIKRNGKLEEEGEWMYFRNVPTKMLGHKIDYISIFKQTNGFGIITHFDFMYQKQDSTIKNLQSVIELGKAISNQLQELGFVMKDDILYNPKYDKFSRIGKLQDREVIVRITDYGTSSLLKVWHYVNK